MRLNEIIDLYKLHDNPETLYGHDRAYNEVPELVWNKITNGRTDADLTDQQKAELKKREYLWTKDPQWAYYYARHVLKGRFPAGEPVIAKDPQWAYEYAYDVINGRFPAGEPVIAKDYRCSYSYARYVIKGRWPPGEDAIAKNPERAYLYAQYVIKGRWPPGEDAIAKDPEIAYYYARHVIKGRWPPGEDAIAKDEDNKEAYAINIMKDPDFWKKKEQGLIENQLNEIDLKKTVAAGIAGTSLLGGLLKYHNSPEQLPPRPEYVEPVRQNDVEQNKVRIAQSISNKYKINNQLANTIVDAAFKYQKDTFPTAKDILGVIGVESSFNPNAVSKLRRDPARGLMQVRPKTWGISLEDLKDVDSQIRIGADILHRYYQKLGDKKKAIHAYNVGITNFKKGKHNPRYVTKVQDEIDTYGDI